MKSIFSAFLPLLFTPGLLIAQSGMLDATFGNGGIVTTNVSANGTSQDFPYAMVAQPDGKILVTGFSTINSADVVLLRYQTNGTLDSTFGINGVVTTDYNGYNSQGNALLLLPDGKIVVAGSKSANNEYDYALFRFLPNGALDNTFGTNGKVVTDVGSAYDVPSAIAMQSDGKLVVAGQFLTGFNLDFAVVRYTFDGQLDTTFGSGGIVITSIKDEDQPRSIAIQPDGNILVAGFAAEMASGDFAVVRYRPDGSPDSTFNDDGIVTTDLYGSDLASAMSLLPDGKILMSGNTNYSNLFGSGNIGLVQYQPDGSLDAGFGTNGTVIVNTQEPFGILNMARQPDGKIFIAVQIDTANDERRWLLTRFRANGAVDTDFGHNGLVTTDLNESNAPITAMLIQADSKVVVAGRSGSSGNYNFTLARYIADFYLSATLQQEISCYGADDAVIAVNVSGGVPPYEYSIDGGTFQTSNVFTGLSGGPHVITIIDSNGDGVVGTLGNVFVPFHDLPPAVTLEVLFNSITVRIAGATGVFQYSKNGGATFQNDSIFSGLANGTYAIAVKDESGCIIFTDQVTINFTSAVTDLQPVGDFRISPNPGDGQFVLHTDAPWSAGMQCTVTDLAGRPVYAIGQPGGGASTRTLDLRFLPAGSYQVRIADGTGYRTKRLIIVR